jgi:hypothetical protein
MRGWRAIRESHPASFLWSLMNPCAESQRLWNEIRDSDGRLFALHRWKQSAFVQGHENTINVVERQIEILLGERARMRDALKQHQKEHGCDTTTESVE